MRRPGRALAAGAAGALAAVPVAWPAPAALAHVPDGDYRWVGADPPPAGLAAVAVPGGQGGAWTPDLQAVLTLAPSAPSPTPVVVTLEPRDAADAGPLGDGVHADGNAYVVTVRVGAAGSERLDAPPTLVLAVPHEATGARFAPGDAAGGTGWEPVPLVSGTAEPGHVAVTAARDGWYVAVTDHDVRDPGEGGLAAAGVAVVVAPPLLLAVVVAIRWRRRVGPENSV